MLPAILSEDSIRPFNFYRDGSVHQGMSYQQRLYRLIEQFKVCRRLQAYDLGCSLATQDNAVAITVSEHAYKVWVELRSNVQRDGAAPQDYRSQDCQVLHR